MEVMIKNQPQDLRVSTVTLQPESGNNVYSFHCSGCGNWNQQIAGRVSKIYPFYEPSPDVPVISTCSRCGKKYTFQTHDGYMSTKVRVILHPTEDVNYFYCYVSKHRVLEYTKSEIRTVQDNKKHITPFFSECPGDMKGTRCDKTYFFAEII